MTTFIVHRILLEVHNAIESYYNRAAAIGMTREEAERVLKSETEKYGLIDALPIASRKIVSMIYDR